MYRFLKKAGLKILVLPLLAAANLNILSLTLAAAPAKVQDSAQVIDAAFSHPADKVPGVVIRVSKLNGTWHFIQALASRTNDAEKLLAAEFDKSKSNTKKNRALIQRYKDRYSQFRGGLMVWTIRARNKAELKDILTATLQDPKDLKDFMAIFTAFEPIYEKLVWKPNLDKLLLKQMKLVEVSNKEDFPFIYGKASTFYRTFLKDPILVSLVPLPEFKGSLVSTVADDVVSMEVGLGEGLAAEGQLEAEYETFFHEVCHILYSRQLEENLQEIQAFWGVRPKPDYNILNEALSSAMNAWVTLRMSGKRKQGPWYGDRRTSLLAKALYPKMLDYMAKGWRIDSEFLFFAKDRYKALQDGTLQGALTPESEQKLFDEAAARLKAMPPSDKSRSKSLVMNVLKYMAAHIRWQDAVDEPENRDPHEWSGGRVVAAGNFNGCVEAAKAFKALYDAVAPRHALMVESTLKGEDGGHAVVEVLDDTGHPFLVDPSGFEYISPTVTEREAAKPEGRTFQTDVDINVKYSSGAFHVARYKFGYLFQEDKRIGKPLELKYLEQVNDWLQEHASRGKTFAELEQAGLIRHEDNGKFKGPGDKTFYIYQKTDDPFNGTEKERREKQPGLEESVKTAK